MKFICHFLCLLISIAHSGFLHAQIEDRQFTPQFLFEQKSETPTILLPPIDTKTLEQEHKLSEKSPNKSLQYASIIDVNINPANDGIWYELENGDKLWTIKIISSKAHSLGVFFKKYRLPKGSMLFLYSADKSHLRGAFTYKNNKSNNALAIAPIKGDELIIEYYEPKHVDFKGELQIGSIAHDYKNIFAYLNKQDKGYGDSGDCNVNVNCTEGENWQTIKQSVCKITFNGWLCTGALVNNTQHNGKPYLITANHCISDSIDAAAAIFYFNFESPTCENHFPLLSQTISGSGLIATPENKSLDFSLLELSINPPSAYNPYYAGWNRDVIDPDTVTSIHHPRGDIKKISVSNNGAITGNYQEGYTEFAHWWIKQWDTGTTEKGSSGSPLFNKEGLIIGDLSGGSADCDSSINDYYQQFHKAWNNYSPAKQQLKYWLDPDSCGIIKLNGYKPFDTIPSNLRLSLNDTIVKLYWNEIIDTPNLKSYLIYKNDELFDSTNLTFYYDTLLTDSVYKYRISAQLKSPAAFETEKSNVAYVRPMRSLSTPFIDDFEDILNVENIFYEERSNDTVGWVFQAGRQDGMMDTSFQGIFNAFYHNSENEFSRLILPTLDLSSKQNAIMSFYLHNQAFHNKNHVLNILYKNTDSVSWQLIRSLPNEYSSWKKINIPLINLSDNYQIALEAKGTGGFGICIDSILVKEDGKHIYPEIYTNKDIMCIYDTIDFFTNLDDSHSLEWDFGTNAIPQTAVGAGPHQVRYSTAGIKPVSLLVNDTYLAHRYDVATVYNITEPDFTRSGNVLTSNADYGNQWYLNDEIIPGATKKEYTVETNGEYALEVTNSNQCVEISEKQYILVSDIEIIKDKPLSEIIKIYPNPNTGTFTIRIHPVDYKSYSFDILDITGRKIYAGILNESGNEKTIRLNNITNGIYLLRIFDGKTYYISKMIIKK